MTEKSTATRPEPASVYVLAGRNGGGRGTYYKYLKKCKIVWPLLLVFILTVMSCFSDIRQVKELLVANAAAGGDLGRASLIPTVHKVSSKAIPFAPSTKNPKRLVPCDLRTKIGIDEQSQQVAQENSSKTTRRFQVMPLNSWACWQQNSEDDNNYFMAAQLDFQIQECPPKYSASTFQLQASTTRSRTIGHVGDRYTVRDGCAIYSATVSVMEFSNISIDLFWTSEYRHYSSHLQDIHNAHTIKTEELSTKEIETMFTAERLAYLDRHLEPLPGFPLQIELQLNQSTTSNLLHSTYSASPPDCGTIPMEAWDPVGVFDRTGATSFYNNTSPFAPKEEIPPWPFRSAWCYFPGRNLKELNDLLAGLRIKMLADR
jgi:hypothetical protein